MKKCLFVLAASMSVSACMEGAAPPFPLEPIPRASSDPAPSVEELAALEADRTHAAMVAPLDGLVEGLDQELFLHAGLARAQAALGVESGNSTGLGPRYQADIRPGLRRLFGAGRYLSATVLRFEIEPRFCTEHIAVESPADCVRGVSQVQLELILENARAQRLRLLHQERELLAVDFLTSGWKLTFDLSAIQATGLLPEGLALMGQARLELTRPSPSAFLASLRILRATRIQSSDFDLQLPQTAARVDLRRVGQGAGLELTIQQWKQILEIEQMHTETEMPLSMRVQWLPQQARLRVLDWARFSASFYQNRRKVGTFTTGSSFVPSAFEWDLSLPKQIGMRALLAFAVTATLSGEWAPEGETQTVMASFSAGPEIHFLWGDEFAAFLRLDPGARLGLSMSGPRRGGRLFQGPACLVWNDRLLFPIQEGSCTYN